MYNRFLLFDVYLICKTKLEGIDNFDYVQCRASTSVLSPQRKYRGFSCLFDKHDKVTDKTLLSSMHADNLLHNRDKRTFVGMLT